MTDHLAGVSVFDDDPFIHEDQLLTDLAGKADFVCHNHHGHAAGGKVPHDQQHLARQFRVWIDRLRATGARTAIQAANMADFYRRSGAHKFSICARPIHDACVTGFLLAPELYEQRQCNVTIELMSPETMGMTIIDWRHVSDKPRNCNVPGRIDSERFFDLMLERLGKLP